MSNNQFACCRFCGQMVLLDDSAVESLTPAALTEMATCECGCDEARAYAEVKARIDRAAFRCRDIFGEDCVKAGYIPVSDEIWDHLILSVELVGKGLIPMIQYKLNPSETAKISLDSKGRIQLIRQRTESFQAQE